MGKTIRWFQKWHNIVKLPKKRQPLRSWEQINPYYFKHELKWIRIKIHRSTRKDNKIRLQKGLDIELEHKTNGWLTW